MLLAPADVPVPVFDTPRSTPRRPWCWRSPDEVDYPSAPCRSSSPSSLGSSRGGGARAPRRRPGPLVVVEALPLAKVLAELGRQPVLCSQRAATLNDGR